MSVKPDGLVLHLTASNLSLKAKILINDVPGGKKFEKRKEEPL